MVSGLAGRAGNAKGAWSWAPATEVATVTAMVVVPPSVAVAGFMSQVACAGMGAQVNVTEPGTPAAEESRSG